MVQEKRRFSERLEYVTSPGWMVRNWPDTEYVPKSQVYGKYCYGGPTACITDMAIFRFDDSGVMYLDTVHPGFSAEDVKNNVDFDLDISRCSGETKPPTYQQLEILYKVVDPEGIFLP
jgi:glutaconate CoA-transferase subunit B